MNASASTPLLSGSAPANVVKRVGLFVALAALHKATFHGF